MHCLVGKVYWSQEHREVDHSRAEGRRGHAVTQERASACGLCRL